MYNFQQVKDKIVELSAQFHLIDEKDIDSMKEVEQLEMEVLELIIDFALQQKIIKNQNDVEIDHTYLDNLSIENEEICNLNWHYTNLFYPDLYENKDQFLEMIKLDL